MIAADCGLCGGKRVMRRSGGAYCPPCQNKRAALRNELRRAGLIGGRPTVEERFWSKVVGGLVDECWLWTAAKDRKGYGKFGASADQSPRMAHRWAYEQLIAPIPPGLELDHLCRTPSCVNPWHCEPVPRAVNQARTTGYPQPGRRGNQNACGPRRQRTKTAPAALTPPRTTQPRGTTAHVRLG